MQNGTIQKKNTINTIIHITQIIYNTQIYKRGHALYMNVPHTVCQILGRCYMSNKKHKMLSHECYIALCKLNDIRVSDIAKQQRCDRQQHKHRWQSSMRSINTKLCVTRYP